MLQFATVPSQHKHEVRGDGQMKELTIGNTKIIIHSDLANKTDEEKEQWFESEKAKGNPILKQISEAMVNCYR